MARHYSPRSFFRQMPAALLARYFREKDCKVEVDVTLPRAELQKAIWDAWMNLPDELRKAIDSDFREIFDMSCESGFRAILDEAEWQFCTLDGNQPAHVAFVETLSALPSHFERAMLAFLDHQRLWKQATLFYHADTLPFWRKRRNLPRVPAAVDDASLAALAASIRTYFHSVEGRGNNCVVEPLRRGELDYFFAYPEDYSQQAVEWVDGTFGRRPHNPAFEVIYVYSQRDGTLDLNFRGTHKAVEPLQAMFAKAILKTDELPPDPKDERVYDLNRLLQMIVHRAGPRVRGLSSGAKPKLASGVQTWKCPLATGSDAVKSKKALAKLSSGTTNRVGANFLQLLQGLRSSDGTVCAT